MDSMRQHQQHEQQTGRFDYVVDVVDVVGITRFKFWLLSAQLFIWGQQEGLIDENDICISHRLIGTPFKTFGSKRDSEYQPKQSVFNDSIG